MRVPVFRRIAGESDVRSRSQQLAQGIPPSRCDADAPSQAAEACRGARRRDVHHRARRMRRHPGPKRSGKSTLVRLLPTLLLPDGGSATIFGHDVVKESRAVQRLVNRVSVEASFFKKMSSEENLAYA